MQSLHTGTRMSITKVAAELQTLAEHMQGICGVYGGLGGKNLAAHGATINVDITTTYVQYMLRPGRACFKLTLLH